MIDFLERLSRQPEYLHVLLNPLPIYGLAIAWIGLIVALILRSRPAQMVALLLVTLSAASAWPVHELGEQAYDRVLSMTDADGHSWLDEHARRAEQLTISFYLLAAASILAMVVPLKWPRSAPFLAIMVVIAATAVLGIGAYIGYAGGKIRHREFRTGPPPTARAPSAGD